jgi:Secretion system C-terminal sorting domain
VSDQVFVSTFPTALNPVNRNDNSLLNISPNPVSTNVTIEYEVKFSGLVQLKIVDFQGKTVRMLLSKSLQPGKYTIQYSAAQFGKGQYYVQLIQQKNIDTTPMLKQ